MLIEFILSIRLVPTLSTAVISYSAACFRMGPMSSVSVRGASTARRGT